MAYLKFLAFALVVLLVLAVETTPGVLAQDKSRGGGHGQDVGAPR